MLDKILSFHGKLKTSQLFSAQKFQRLQGVKGIITNTCIINVWRMFLDLIEVIQN